ncbi:MAG: VWA domain-containing protein [Candidatus Marinimicrobia bacterium]|jgi:Ca-activated chloride channel family protein|nr:VWA domain-containing protein [Candidatus Neomarinimicrobiota bacterium]MDP6853370.1 VWA domain-containing protein [Candidatus Neomarinimicrobiota bacterium]MDP6936763.1 VWA domain-containing protein [Candidatus Neomarinimicrobiota bacterium]
MVNIEFAQPLYLILLFILPILAYWYAKKGVQKEATVRFSNLDLIPSDVLRIGRNKNRILIGSKLSIMLLIVLALARPRLADTVQETNTEIIDILLVIDQSSSMLAQDFKPNRLEAAKEVAKTFIKAREGDRLGLIVFAGESYIQCPLTRDIDVLLKFTDQIDIIDREHDGTAIGMAIANAINRLRDSKAESKTIILLSDGSNNQGELDPITAADLAAKFDIKIYTVAAGTHGLAPYPVTDAWGRKVIQKVQVEVDEETLQEIAEITGGRFFRATDNESLQKVYTEIDALERTEIEVTEYQNYTELYSYFTIPAALASLLLIFLTRGIFHKLF